MIVEIPGIGNVEFPDDTPPEEIQRVFDQARRGPSGDKINALTDQARAAYEAGNDAEGKRLLVEASRLSADSGMAPEGFTADPRTGGMIDLRSDQTIPGGRGTAMAVGLGQGLGYDFLDEAVGGIAGVANAAGLSDIDARFATERVRETDRRAKEDFPVSYAAPKIGGAVAQSLGLAKMLGITPATTWQGRSAQGAAIGGGEGAAFGLGQGEGIRDRIMDMLKYGGLGVGIGAAVPAVIAGGRAAYDKAIAGPAASMRSAPSETRASRAVMNAMRKAGTNADNLDDALTTAAREGQPEYMMADALGKPGQRLLGSVYRTADEAQGEISDYLLSRQAGQAERLSNFVDEGFDLGGETAKAARTAVIGARDDAADMSFGTMRSNGAPVDIRGVVSAIDEKVAPFRDANINSPARNALESLRRQLVGQSDDATYELSDFGKVFAIRRELRDTISELYRGGKSELASDLKSIRQAMDDALQAASPQYRQAMDDFATQSRIADAFDTGAEMSRPSVRAADNATTFSAMTPEQQAAARAGYGDKLLARIEAAAGETTNRARPLTSPKVSADVRTMATDPALLSNRVGRETTMHETARKVLGGSETAERLADDALMDAHSMGIFGNLLRGNLREAGVQAGLGAVNTMQGRNTATREMIARMLMSRDPRAAVAAALMAESRNAPRAFIAEAIGRSLPRPAQ